MRERRLRRPRQDLILSGQNIFINQPRQVICLVNIVAECATAGYDRLSVLRGWQHAEDLLEDVTKAKGQVDVSITAFSI